MIKLNNKKIKWIVQQKQCGKTNAEIALAQKVSIRRVQQIYQEHKSTGSTPVLKQCGRKPITILDELKQLILNEQKRYALGPLALEVLIRRKHKIHIPHNTIYRVMLKANRVIENAKKKEQRKWVRYERPHSLDLVHTDWTEYNGIQTIAFIDDSSRKILSCMEFDNATTENALIALKAALRAAKPYGDIIQLISDHGTQFTANKLNQKGTAEHKFRMYVESRGIDFINARVSHPQTNGKIEKWFDLYKIHRDRFKSLKGFLHWYGKIKPHMSLKFNKAETPDEAFLRKMRIEVWFSKAAHWF